MKLTFVFMITLLLISIMTTAVPVFAESNHTIPIDTVNPIDAPSETPVEPEVPTVTPGSGEITTFTQLVERVTYRLNEVLDAFRAIANPLIMILFVASAITALFGAMSKKGSVWNGVWAMLVAALTFSVITHSETIVALFTSWLVS